MSIQHANRGIVKKDLQLYYNREYVKSFRGESSTNYTGTVCSNHESGGATGYWVSTVTKDLSTGYLAYKVIPLAGGYQYATGVWASCGIIAGGGGYQPPGTYSLSAKVLLPAGSVFTYGFRAYPQGEFFSADVNGTGTWQTIKVENFVATNYNFLQFQMVRKINGSTGANSPIFPGDPFWVRDLMINSGAYAETFSIMTNELSARPENTTNITNNANFASSISGTDSGGTQNGWTFSSWSGSGNSYITQGSTIIYSSGNISYSAIPLRVTRTSAGSMDFFSSNWNTLSNGTVYTISFWARSSVDTVTLDIVHQNLGTIKSYAVYTGWYKYTGKFTHAGGTQYPYLRHNGSNGTWIEIANVQLEAKSYPTDFTTTNRTNVANTVAGGGGLLDISGNNINANLTNVSFDSGGYYFTTAGSNYINTGITTLPSNTQLTIDVWTKPTSTTQAKTLVSKWGSSSQSNFCFLLFLNFFGQGNIYFLVGDSAGTNYSTHSIAHNLSTSAYSNFTVVYDNGLVSWYRNGVFIQTDTNGNKPLKSVTTAITIGADYDGGNPDTLTRSYDGTIPNVKLYSRPLTAAEVLQNFNANKATYGL